MICVCFYVYLRDLCYEISKKHRYSRTFNLFQRLFIDIYIDLLIVLRIITVFQRILTRFDVF